MGEVGMTSLHTWNDCSFEFFESKLGVRRLVALWIVSISYCVTTASNIFLTCLWIIWLVVTGRGPLRGGKSGSHLRFSGRWSYIARPFCS
ncbi:uncharacterized protein BT62DRAFT_685727 [Guyanagaster necrorhizus]|uniref:Uncharacterized protein n=1 Tax=Guyanagaster necrorhizus TaxID=856835 RepID=A0A9P7VZ81_9AGAR|nr:uncharacterized protein BT62DRAFT_685727 [Guyanagaster necrorhizus MCA 3950]KAG7449470.1 hypothetical protein BT62DRAFT_685727 [Guyanagaster necrorhizus MCA 3950]